MNNEILRTSTISEIVNKNPGVIPVLERLHIDYCCNGKLVFNEACKRANVREADVLAALAAPAADAVPALMRAKDWSLDLLANFIVQNHHQYVKSAIPEILSILEKVVSKHGASHPEVVEVSQQFKLLMAELQLHMYNEEHVLFPVIIALVKACTKASLSDDSQGISTADLSPAISTQETEHELAGHYLERIRSLSQDFALPVDACNTFRLLYQRLREFEEDLHIHIHLENNLLFPKTLQMQARENIKPLYINRN